MVIGFLLSSCQKKDIEKQPILSEIIYGDWEIRERMDVLTYGDWEYHKKTPPYLTYYQFNEDGTFNRFYDDTPDYSNSMPFEVNDQDSLLILTHTYKVYEFNEGMIDMRIWGREGPSGFKIYKRQ
jgi:hypothetical protein